MTRHYHYSNIIAGEHLLIRIQPDGRTEHVTIDNTPGFEDFPMDYHRMVRAMTSEPKFTVYLKNWLNIPFKPNSEQKERA